VISVLAHIDDGYHGTATEVGGQAMDGSPFYVIALPRHQVDQLGEITFRLIDEFGKERATTVATIR
jgi:hypothetical protein